MAAEQAARQGHRPGGGDGGRAALDGRRLRRHRTGRAAPLRSRQEDARASIPRAREAAARASRAHAGHPLQVVRRPGDSRLPDASEGPAAEEPAAGAPAARRSLGTRLVGVRFVRAVPRQPWIRRAAAQLPRLHGLRQEIPRRRQQPVGREDAGRRHLGREASRRRGYRRSETDRNHGRLVRRLRDARRRRVHTRTCTRRPFRSSGPRTC